MATSSSDESSTAPRDFHLSSSLDSGSQNSPNRQKCPLCSRFRKKFYCKECIHSGEFSNSIYEEKFSDKQIRLKELKLIAKNCEDLYMKQWTTKFKEGDLCSNIKKSKDRIGYLKQANIEKKSKLSALKDELREIKTRNGVLNSRLPVFREKCEQIEYVVAGKHEKREECLKYLSKIQQDAKKITRIRIGEIIKYIFPITIVQPKSEIESSAASDMVSALAEATHTTYIRDRWVYTDSSGELQHCIVGPSLPSSGNYSAYNIWVTQNKDAVPVPGGSSNRIVVSSNPAYNISGALTYTAQLLNVIAFYLDIRLAHKICYSDFCTSDMTEQQFSRRIARLNANVLYLCFMQNTKLEMMHASRTLHNILHLLDTNVSDVGRQGPLEINPILTSHLEEQIASDLQPSEDSDSEEGDALPYEWEAVPHVQCPEVPAGIVALPSQQMTTTQQASSMAGGLVTSAAASLASFWRGWTAR